MKQPGKRCARVAVYLGHEAAVASNRLAPFSSRTLREAAGFGIPARPLARRGGMGRRGGSMRCRSGRACGRRGGSRCSGGRRTLDELALRVLARRGVRGDGDSQRSGQRERKTELHKMVLQCHDGSGNLHWRGCNRRCQRITIR